MHVQEVNLLIAAWNGHLDEVQVCLLNKANFDYKNRVSSRLGIILRIPRSSSLEVMDHMHRLFCFYQRGETALIIAAQEGHVEVVSLLLTAGADLEAANYVRNCLISVLL